MKSNSNNFIFFLVLSMTSAYTRKGTGSICLRNDTYKSLNRLLLVMYHWYKFLYDEKALT